jgi:SNF2 family DNA or RNA helicase
MKKEKNYTELFKNLLETLSDFEDQTLEDAKEMLLAAGENPDTFIMEARKKLDEIKATAKASKSHRLDNIKYQHDDMITFSTLMLVMDKDSCIVELMDSAPSYSILNADEIFSTFIKKKPLRGCEFENIKFTEQSKKIEFLRLAAQLKFKINIHTFSSTITAFVQGLTSEYFLKPEQINFIIRTGYFIIIDNQTDYKLVPIDKESIDWSREFLSNLKNGYELPFDKVLWFYNRRSELRYLHFDEDQLDFCQLFGGNNLATHSDLFVKSLYNYQKEGVKWLAFCCLNRMGGILADDMGLGKTAQIIALIAWLSEKNILDKILIVVPGTLLENWRREFYFFTPSLKPYIHHGPDRTGSLKVLEKHRVIITSYSIVINDLYLFNKIQWGITICDEASLIKNPDSERRIALNALPSHVRIAMTGTPVENSLLDLWSLGDYVNPNYLGTRKEFANKYIKADIESTISTIDLSSLKKYISVIMLRRKKEDVLDSLPRRIDIHQALEMGENEAALYDEQRKNILSKTEGRTGVNVLKEILDLRRFTTHPIILRNEQPTIYDLASLSKESVKLERTIEILNEIKDSNEKVLIFTEYLNMIDIFKQVLSTHYKIGIEIIDGRIATEDRQKSIDIFSQTKGFSIMILNPRTGGMGLNITAANHVIHYTRQWNPALEEQASARAYRNGQKKGVNIYYLYYANTIEEVIDVRLKTKKSLSGEVIVPTDEISQTEYEQITNISPLKTKK